MRLRSPQDVTDDSSQDGPLGVQAGGDEDRDGVVHALAQLGRVVGDGHRVQIHDAVDRLARLVLTLDVAPDRADVVAQVLAPGGLDAAEDPHSPRHLAGARCEA
jgi:hypothetical protein